MNSISLEAAGLAVPAIVAAVQRDEQRLGRIDGAIGDGDHGVNMAKGFRIAGSRLGNPTPNLKVGLTILSDTLLGDIGGSMGPLYGTFFAEMANAAEDSKNIDSTRLLRMLRSGLNAVQDLGGAKPGDKTLVDVLAPACSAFEEGIESQASFADCLKRMSEAADGGFESTKDMVARVGRAARLGERSRGTHDAGAASCALILATLADSLVRQLTPA